MNTKPYTETCFIAAGGVSLLAVIFITGCSLQPVAAVPPPTRPATMTPPAATATPTTPPPATGTAPASVTASATATATASATASTTATASATASATATATASTAATTAAAPSSGITITETTLTLLTAPYRDYLIEQTDPRYGMPILYFNRPQFTADAPTPQPLEYSGIVLENPYLRLTFVPELGGRLYSAVVKATGQEIFYHNPVIQPSRYGVLQPAEANWWLAAGGIEWAYPVQEHGYRFGVPWQATVSRSDSAATITLSDAPGGPAAMRVQVTLPATAATFSIAPTFTNSGPEPLPAQVWLNAALSLSAGSMAPDTQFVLPTSVITIHSRGQAGWELPDAATPAPWPQAGDTNLSDYRQWANYLGFFAANAQAPFIGATNPRAKLGVVRLVSPDAPGAGKLFAFGADFPDRSYTSDNSQYFEIWGGANNGFWPENDISVPPGGSVTWQETWWPLAGLPGLTWATDSAAIHLQQSGTDYTLSALLSRPVSGRLRVMTAAGETLLNQPFDGEPQQPLTWQFDAAAAPLSIEFTDSSGSLLLNYEMKTQETDIGN